MHGRVRQALANIREETNNPFRYYYEDLLGNKGYTEYNARHAVSRRIAIVTLGVFKSNKKFKDQWSTKCKEEKKD